MACDVKLKPNQTISQRAAEVRSAVERLAQAIAARRVRPVVGPQGAIAFQGWDETSRDGVTDACAYRTLMRSGDAMSRMLIQQAEQLAGRGVNKQAVAHGHHSHDGGKTWHRH